MRNFRNIKQNFLKQSLLILSYLSIVFFTSCKEEYSCESCMPVANCSITKTSGSFVASLTLLPANTMTVQINIKTPGPYTITTDTVNGYYFSATGNASIAGNTSITLAGQGTPVAAGTDQFTVHFNDMICGTTVTVTAPAGPLPDYELICEGMEIGSLIPHASLSDIGSFVVVRVNVFTPGPYALTTNTVNGVTYSASGTFTTTGVQTVNLQATGAANGVSGDVFHFTFSHNNITCSFDIVLEVTAQVLFNFCQPYDVYGHLRVGEPLRKYWNYINIKATVNSTGYHYYSTPVINGVRFFTTTHFGNTPTNNVSTLTITGEGTPLAAGTFQYPFDGCLLSVTYVDAATIPTWSFNRGNNPYGGVTGSASLTTATLPQVLEFTGLEPMLGNFHFSLHDVAGGINAGEEYVTFDSGNNYATFEFVYNDGIRKIVNDNFNNVVIKVTSHNVAAKTITGTFVGNTLFTPTTILVPQPITNGQFTVVYP